MVLLLRAALRLCPREFRRECGPALVETWQVQRARARRRGMRDLLRYDLRALTDMIATATALRAGRSLLHPEEPAPRSRRVPGRSPHEPYRPMQNLLTELRHALRRLFASPVFAAATVLVLAVGIGVNTTMFSLVSALLLRPQPFAEPERLVDVYQDSDEGEPSSSSFPAYRDMAAHTDLFEGTAAAMFWTASLLGEDGAVTMPVEYVTSNYFELLGVPLLLGPGPGSEADLVGGPPVVVLSAAAWRSRFEGDPEVVGRTIRINGASVTVVGVAAPGYGGLMPGMHRELFLSLSCLGPTIGDYAAGTLERRDDHWFMVKGRLADGVEVAQAQAAMDALAARLAREYPDLNDGRDITVFGAGEIRVHPTADGELRGASTALAMVAGLLLLLVCSNLANLMLVRATTRGHEVSLRLALGASRGQIVSHVVSESLLLAAAGGLGGMLLAWYLTGLLGSGAIPLPLPATLDLRLDTSVLTFTAVLSVLVGLAFGLLPAWRLTRSDAMSVLRGEAAALSSGRRTRWLRNGLVATQVAASCVILVLATLFARSLANAGNVDLGFGAAEVAVLRTDVAHAGYDASEAGPIYDRLRERVAALPGIDSVALAGQLPLAGGGSSTLSIEGYQSERGTGFVEVDRSTVSPGYFATMRIPVLHGREFDEADAAGDNGPVAMVSRAMARAYWGRDDVVGERFGFQSSPDTRVEVVGVAADVKVDSVAEEPTPLFYLVGGGAARYLLARTGGPATAALPDLRAALTGIDATLPTLQLTTLEAHVQDSLSLRRVGTLALGGFGGLGLLLAGLGLYAVVAYAVQQRTREIGIRMVLGASARELVGAVVREMVLIILVAGAVGLAIGRAIAPLFADGLVGVSGLDLTTALLAAGMLLLTAMLAGWLPARRATRLDPVEALRAE